MASPDLPAAGRIHTIDALRGFALLAILLVHLPEYLIYDVYRMAPDSPQYASSYLHSLGQPVADILFFLFAGKSYSIFALLFGVTFAIQYTRRERQGGDFAGRYAWRLLWLAVFGCINSIFFPGGDVLVSFALFGLVLIPFRKLKPACLLGVALLFLIQPVQLYYAIQLLIDPSWTVPRMRDLMDVREYYGMVADGSFTQMFLPNLTTGQFASFAWTVDHGRLTQMPALFLMGCALGKGGYFDITPRNRNFWFRILGVALAGVFLFHWGRTLAGSPKGPMAEIFEIWYNVSFSAIWVALFVLLQQLGGFRKWTQPLNGYGRMSLTNYIMQAVAGSFVFFPWGLNLISVFEPIVCVIIGLALGLLQITASNLWLRFFRQGPLETIWHKLTWLGCAAK